MRWEHDCFVLSTGRRVYVATGEVGISSDGFIGYGQEGQIDTTTDVDDYRVSSPRRGAWTREERRELATEMIRLWQLFALAEV